MDAAIPLIELEKFTNASWVARASNLFGAVRNGIFVSRAISSETSLSKPFLVLIPVPTAVPPCAR